MAKCDFYKSKEILQQVPALSKYIDVKGEYKVGISNNWNLKYSVPNGRLEVIPKSEIDIDTYSQLLQIMAPDSPISSIPMISEKHIELQQSYFSKLAPALKLPDTIEGCFYAKNNSNELYYRRRRGKKNKLVERVYDPGIYNQDAVYAIVDILKKTEGDTQKLDEIIQSLEASRASFIQHKKDFDKNLLKELEPLGTLRTNLISPIITLQIKSDFGDYNTCIVLSEEKIEKKAKKWVSKCKKLIINKHNNKKKKERFKTVDNEIISFLTQFFKKKNLSLINVLFEAENLSESNQKNIVTIKGITEKGIGISKTKSFAFLYQEELVKQVEYINDERVDYVITKEGKAFAKLKAKSIFDTLICDNWNITKCNTEKARIEIEFNKLNETYKRLNVSLKSGKRWQKTISTKFMYDFSKKRIFLDSPLAYIYINDKNKVVSKEKDFYKEMIRETSLKRHESASKYFHSKINASDTYYTNFVYVSGDGVLYGDTEIKIKEKDISFNYVWKTSSYTESLTAWKKQTDRNFKELKILIEKEKAEKRERDIKLIDSFAGNFIAIDVAEFIEKNEMYITENAVVRYFRGLKQTFNGYINDTGKKGKYKYTSSGYVENIINRMIYEGILTTKKLKGTYGSFYILKTTFTTRLLKPDMYPEIDLKEIKKQVENSKKVRDCYAELLYLDFKQKGFENPSDYLILLNLIQSVGFICSRYDELISVLKNAPDTVKQYIKMRKEMTEDDFEKKLLIQVLKK